MTHSNPVRPGILSRKRITPVHNLRGEAFEKTPDRENLSWAAEQIRQFEVMMEIEDMENDRTCFSIFRDNTVL